MAVTYLELIPLFPELLSSQTHLAAVSGVSVSTKRSGCPAQSQTCPGSVFRSWVWMEYPSLLPTENLWVPFLVLIPKCQKWGRIFFHVWEVYYHPRHHYSASSSSFSSLGTAPGNTWYTDGQGALTLGYQSPTDTKHHLNVLDIHTFSVLPTWGQFAGMIVSSGKCSKNILIDTDKSVYSEGFQKKCHLKSMEQKLDQTEACRYYAMAWCPCWS